jgi:hypothetical protein
VHRQGIKRCLRLAPVTNCNRKRKRRWNLVWRSRLSSQPRSDGCTPRRSSSFFARKIFRSSGQPIRSRHQSKDDKQPRLAIPLKLPAHADKAIEYQQPTRSKIPNGTLSNISTAGQSSFTRSNANDILYGFTFIFSGCPCRLDAAKQRYAPGNFLSGEYRDVGSTH